MDFNLQDLEKFLGKTLSQTYATGENKIITPERPGFEEYGLTEGDWSYRDSYFGGSISWGQESVFYQGVPAWSLIYGGGMLKELWDDKELEKLTFGVMKKALIHSRNGKDEFLPRGPRCFRDDTSVYIAEWEGDITWFRGQEKVFVQDKLVHIYDFAGGLYVK